MSEKIFLSVGKTNTLEQEKFIKSIENRLKEEGFSPQTVGRNNFTSGTPLKLVDKLMNECLGTVVIALERFFFSSGVDRRGNKDEKIIKNIKMPTSWNQIEAAMAYCHEHPLMIIVENGIKSEGLLEKGYDWYVQSVDIDPAALRTEEFNGVLADWKRKVLSRHENNDSFVVRAAEMPRARISSITLGRGNKITAVRVNPPTLSKGFRAKSFLAFKGKNKKYTKRLNKFDK